VGNCGAGPTIGAEGKVLATMVFLASLILTLIPPAPPVKLIILAGQSNMEGHAVVDLAGKDYNDGKGTLVSLMNGPSGAARFGHLRSPDGKWVVRTDVFVRYQRESQPLLKGPLGLGFSVYGDQHHFGPELQFGHVIGSRVENPVLLVKTAWGGKSLYTDFRPPSSGGETGKYYKLMVTQVREAIANLGQDFPSIIDRKVELAGLVWYQGWNDGVDPKNAIPEYEQNLVNLIKDFRKEINAPKLPVIVAELTGPWVQAPDSWDTLRKAQEAATKRPEFSSNVLFVPTHDFVRNPEDSPNSGHGHHEFGNAETYFMVGDAMGKGLLKLMGLAPN
jgi:Carbohydrate esterase, sialic acid-specific acetylesterase